MTARRSFPRIATLLTGASVAFWLVSTGAVQAQKSAAASQLRRTVDPSERSAYGSVVLQQNGAKQTVEVTVRNLGEESFSIFLGDHLIFDTNTLVSFIGPLNRVNESKGIWERDMEGNGGPPAEFSSFKIDDIGDLAGTFLVIARPGDDLLIGVTNIVGNTTNVIFGLPLPYPDITNAVFGVLWAPIPPLVPKPNSTSFSRKAELMRADTPFPDPKVSGDVKARYYGSQGRSVLDIRAKRLFAGQVYTVYIADPDIEDLFLPAGEMELSKKGSSGRFIRDTKYGDPLPQQAGNVDELSGRPMFIADEFGTVYLEGFIP